MAHFVSLSTVYKLFNRLRVTYGITAYNVIVEFLFKQKVSVANLRTNGIYPILISFSNLCPTIVVHCLTKCKLPFQETIEYVANYYFK